MNHPVDVDSLVQSVRSTPKYATINVELVRALVEQELAKGRNSRETVKAVRSKLHQIGGAYQQTPIDYAQFAH